MINLSIIQDAIGQLLASDASVTAALGTHDGRILGGPDPLATFPYLTIGEDETRDASVQFLTGKTFRFPVHIWTQEAGFAQCKEIEAAVVAALDDEDGFSLPSGLRCVCSFHEGSRFMRDPRNGIKHGVAEFTAEIEATD